MAQARHARGAVFVDIRHSGDIARTGAVADGVPDWKAAGGAMENG